jgi:hypothetical protein
MPNRIILDESGLALRKAACTGQSAWVRVGLMGRGKGKKG